jgi:hypothetical protein
VSTTTDSNGALNVFIGNGQPLVLQNVTPRDHGARISSTPRSWKSDPRTSGGVSISGNITSGDLGGLLRRAAR